MLNRPLRLGVRHRAFVIGWWERLVPVTVGLFVAGLCVACHGLCRRTNGSIITTARQAELHRISRRKAPIARPNCSRLLPMRTGLQRKGRRMIPRKPQSVQSLPDLACPASFRPFLPRPTLHKSADAKKQNFAKGTAGKHAS